MARALIVDADTTAGGILRHLLEELDMQVQVVRSAREAREAVQERRLDLILLEAQLPDGDGVELAADLRGRRYRGPLVFVASRSEPGDLLRGFAAGADDYVAKPYEPAILVAKLDAILRRCASADAQPLGAVVRADDAELNLGTLTYRSAATQATLLAPTEMRLLELLMRNAGIVIGRETLIERVWGYDFYGDTNRVDVYIRRLRRKIESNPDDPRYLRTVRGVGYVFRPDPIGREQRGVEDDASRMSA